MIDEFIRSEISGAVLLFAATVAAVLWANSAWHAAYEALWKLPLGIHAGGQRFSLDLRHGVDDGLMAVFFMVVGLEIKRELVKGELASPRQAALPIVAALGGMIAPAAIYLAFNPTRATSHGWGIPMATDIGFALGVLALLGKRMPAGLRVFLLALAIVDDVGAILVIAIFYTAQLSFVALAVACALTALLALVAWRVDSSALFLGVAFLLWVAVLASGVHATIAGVLTGLLAPLTPRRESASESMAEGLERRIHPWVSFAILPIFALANAGVPLNLAQLKSSLSSPVALGIFFGLVAGKPVGVLLASFCAVRSGVARMAEGLSWRSLAGAGLLAGVGFTVALFIGGLAFTDDELIDASKVAILAASLVAGALGYVYLRVFARSC
jgi:NhaA family Na+:H+ antiporter